ncbi:phosphotransferase [Cohnella sp. CFH 77786]|uniref:aminoglycoside phosphotransferase family protein n=1 Tax=Cohnella sp. CFH 77786 TaxID=2662265 RepID=UPI001C60BB0E|nr:aminoglycoside phosphotransferase family protein [Cohnella sp. CFH 77786]MBW5447184.1 phosphotransferase [Cohnella sp. CFH 77786]
MSKRERLPAESCGMVSLLFPDGYAMGTVQSKMGDVGGLVLPNGELNAALLLQTEEISAQKNVGRLSLQRLWVQEQDAVRSYIFKPAPEKEPIEFEIWFQERIKPHLTDVRTPGLLAHRIDEERQIYWMIYEDMGSAPPSFDRDTRIAAARKMAAWHTLPASAVPSAFKSFMPYIDDAMSEVMARRAYYEKLLLDIGMNPEKVAAFFERIENLNGVFPCEKVVCHGDFHCLNLLRSSGDLAILDWEFIQLNSIYWDFYTLLDMATPRYRILIDRRTRLDVLDAYYRQRSGSIPLTIREFVYGYHLYSMVYSVGILGLVVSDLENNRFDKETLLVEKDEVIQIIRDCLEVIAT